MNSTRITGDDTSRVSMCVGLGVAVVLIVGVFYLVFASHALTSETGFDPNRPVPSNSVMRSRLKPDKYHVTRERGTETAFQNEYWNNVRLGIYIDDITGEPHYCLLEKFDSGTGRLHF